MNMRMQEIQQWSGKGVVRLDGHANGRRREFRWVGFMWLIACILTTIPFSAFSELPAFPGAEGSGALAKGGRGGAVCEVTNLNDSGPGSLRSCVDLTGPRTVIFEVGGTIVLKTPLFINNPYITIAGQTAPGGGIQLTAKEPGTFPWCGQKEERGAIARSTKDYSGATYWDGSKWVSNNCPNNDFPLTNQLIKIQTSDVIIRYLRLRPGYTGPNAYQKLSALGVYSNAGRSPAIGPIIIDHVSVNWWGSNGLIINDNTTGKTVPFRNITIQDSIFGETLFYFRYGMHVRSDPDTVDAGSSLAGRDMGDIDFLRNMFSTSNNRNPLIGGMKHPIRYVNNIFYNSEGPFAIVRAYNNPRNRLVDFIGNRFDLGPLQPKASCYDVVPIAVARYDANPSSLHISGNYDHLRHGYNQSAMARILGGSGTPSEYTPVTSQCDGVAIPSNYLRSEPAALPAGAIPFSVIPVDDLDDRILPTIGASKRLDCEGNWVSNRDAVDTRIIEEGYWNRAPAFLPYHEDEVGGYPVIGGGGACADTTGDGVPDAWLVRNGLDPAEPIGSQFHDSGYTFLELYLNGEQIAARPAAPGDANVE